MGDNNGGTGVLWTIELLFTVGICGIPVGFSTLSLVEQIIYAICAYFIWPFILGLHFAKQKGANMFEDMEDDYEDGYEPSLFEWLLDNSVPAISLLVILGLIILTLITV